MHRLRKFNEMSSDTDDIFDSVFDDVRESFQDFIDEFDVENVKDHPDLMSVPGTYFYIHFPLNTLMQINISEISKRGENISMLSKKALEIINFLKLYIFPRWKSMGMYIRYCECLDFREWEISIEVSNCTWRKDMSHQWEIF